MVHTNNIYYNRIEKLPGLSVSLIFLTYLYFSIKYVTQFAKDGERSPLFSKSGKLSGISHTLYDLLLCGLRGNLKKDAVLSVLREISVSC